MSDAKHEIPVGQPDFEHLDADLKAILAAKTPEERDLAVIAAHQESRRRMRRWGLVTLRAIAVMGVLLAAAFTVGQFQNKNRTDDNSNLIQAQANERAANSLKACEKDDRDNANFTLFLKDLIPKPEKQTPEQKAGAKAFLDKARERYPFHAVKPKTDAEVSRSEFCKAQVKKTVKTGKASK